MQNSAARAPNDVGFINGVTHMRGRSSDNPNFLAISLARQRMEHGAIVRAAAQRRRHHFAAAGRGG